MPIGWALNTVKRWERHRNIQTPSGRTAFCGHIEGWLGIIVNMLLFVTKGLLGFSIHSSALIADAFDSLSDMLASMAIVVGLKASNKPADSEHPFGHGRAEFITVFITSGFLFLAGYEILKSSLSHIWNPRIHTPSWGIIVFVVATIVIKEVMARFSHALGEHSNSESLKADSAHHRADALTSVLVLVALLSSYVHWQFLDGVMGVAISLFILYTAFRTAMRAISPLLGEGPSMEELREIQDIALKHPNILNIHDIVYHKYGHNRLISFHIEISDTNSLQSAHRMTEDLELAIQKQIGAAVVVHIDPVNPEHPLYKAVLAELDAMLIKIPQIRSYYSLRLIDLQDGTTEASFCVSLQRMLPEDNHSSLRNMIHSHLQQSFPSMHFAIHIAPTWAYTPINNLRR